jgi:hypothetical protein
MKLSSINKTAVDFPSPRDEKAKRQKLAGWPGEKRRVWESPQDCIIRPKKGSIARGVVGEYLLEGSGDAFWSFGASPLEVAAGKMWIHQLLVLAAEQ